MRRAICGSDSVIERVAPRRAPAGKPTISPMPCTESIAKAPSSPAASRACEPSRSTRLRIRNGLNAHRRPGTAATRARARARPGQHRQHRRRHQHRDEGRRHGVGEEILDQLDIVGRQRHQIAGAPPREIGRRQRIELAEHVDAHLGQQPERHLMGDPGFQPVQRRRRAAPPPPAPISIARHTASPFLSASTTNARSARPRR